MKKTTVSIVVIVILIIAAVAGVVIIKSKDNSVEPGAKPSIQASEVKKDAESGKEETTATAEPKKAPKVTDEKGNEVTKNPTATTPPLEVYKEYTEHGAKVYENEYGEIQADMPDGTSEILWSPYIGEGSKTEKEQTAYEQYKKVPNITKEEEIISIVDGNGKVKEYIGSDNKEFASAYDTVFTYNYYCYGGPDTVEECLNKMNEVCVDELKYTDDKKKEIIEQTKNDGTEESFRFGDVIKAAFTEDGNYAGFLYNIGYTSNGEDKAEAWYLYLEKVDGKWLMTSERPSAIVKGLGDPSEKK